MMPTETSALWRFNQLHLAVASAVQDHHLAFGVAEDEDIAVPEVGFFDGLFERHGAHGDGIVGADQVDFGGFRDGRILVHHDGDSRLLRHADYGLQIGLRHILLDVRRVAIPLLHFLALARRALLRLPARFVLDGLLLEMVEGFVDGDGHVLGLSQADQRAIARADGDFSFVAMLFNREDDFGIKSVAQNLADLREAGFYFFADSGSDGVMSASIFDVHDASTRLNFDFKRKNGFSTTKYEVLAKAMPIAIAEGPMSHRDRPRSARNARSLARPW